jgi:ubiquinone/menaquinone biosynthesis C-methylase UbiE
MSEFKYEGDELSLFQHASNWKAYFGKLIGPYLGGSVLEVGAGNGATTQALISDAQIVWTCLEPDPSLAASIGDRIRRQEIPQRCRIIASPVTSLSDSERFDSILYIDVLEHIDQDSAELDAASRHLNIGGHLIVLSPAHQYLYSPFDASIGHVRRYNKKMLSESAPKGMKLVRMKYLDSVGALASLANKIVLRQGYPTLKQILFWDRWLVPASRIVDPLVAGRVGKSILGIWQKS